MSFSVTQLCQQKCVEHLYDFKDFLFDEQIFFNMKKAVATPKYPKLTEMIPVDFQLVCQRIIESTQQLRLCFLCHLQNHC